MNEKIIEIIKQINPYEEITEETELIETGILDSFSLVFVINELQTEFDFVLPEETLQAENFSSVNKIGELLMQFQK